jgi:hypothetical protein
MPFSTAIIIVLIILIILTLATIAKTMPVWGNKNLTYYQKQARETFDHVSGDTWGENNQSTIDYLTSVPDEYKDAYDHFAAGAVHVYGRRNARKAALNYHRALEDIERGNVFEDDRDFILGRIRDHVQYNMDTFGEEELKDLNIPLDRIYERIAANDIQEAMRISKLPTTIQKETNPNAGKIAAAVEKQAPAVHVDPQNVHDASVTLEFSRQLKKLRIYNDDDAEHRTRILDNNYNNVQKALTAVDNAREDKLNEKAHKEFMEWMEDTLEDPKQVDELRRRFANDFTLIDKSEQQGPTIKERDVIATVWRRINSPQNKKNREKLKEALANNLIGCFENDRPVCTTGRTEQIFSSLVSLDSDPEIGNFVTSDILKGTMYSEGSKIIDAEINKLPDNVKDAYNASSIKDLSKEDKEKLDMTIKTITTRIDSEISEKYNQRLPQADIAIVVNNIKKVANLDE